MTRTLKYPFVVLFISTLATFGYSQSKAKRFDAVVRQTAASSQFSGSILIAENGKVVYQNSFGVANAASRTPFRLDTPSNIASLSKQFTAMAVMMLQERGQMSYDDPLTKYFPEFPQYAKSVTVGSLLNHTSGIPDYLNDLRIGRPGLTSKDVLNTLIKLKEPQFPAGEKFAYSNSGYLLLSLIVEKVADEPFRSFLAKNIFRPLGMRNSFVQDGSAPLPATRAIGYGRFGKPGDYDIFTTGDGSIYSSVNDLFLWSNALSTEKLVKRATLAEAFKSRRLNDGKDTNYGFGWSLRPFGPEPMAGHGGAYGGFKTGIVYAPQSRKNIIFLTNKGLNKPDAFAEALVSAFVDTPFNPPKRSVADAMYKIYRARGLAAAVKFYVSVKQRTPAAYELDFDELNDLGYRMMELKDTNAAIRILKLNVASFPTDANAFDSLGEAYMMKGDRALAIANYKRSLELDKSNSNAEAMLKKLEK